MNSFFKKDEESPYASSLSNGNHRYKCTLFICKLFAVPSIFLPIIKWLVRTNCWPLKQTNQTIMPYYLIVAQ